MPHESDKKIIEQYYVTLIIDETAYKINEAYYTKRSCDFLLISQKLL